MTKLEEKYPMQFERARLLTSRELQRGLSFYKNRGEFTHAAFMDEGRR